MTVQAVAYLAATRAARGARPAALTFRLAQHPAVEPPPDVGYPGCQEISPRLVAEFRRSASRTRAMRERQGMPRGETAAGDREDRQGQAAEARLVDGVVLHPAGLHPGDRPGPISSPSPRPRGDGRVEMRDEDGPESSGPPAQVDVLEVHGKRRRSHPVGGGRTSGNTWPHRRPNREQLEGRAVGIGEQRGPGTSRSSRPKTLPSSVRSPGSVRSASCGRPSGRTSLGATRASCVAVQHPREGLQGLTRRQGVRVEDEESVVPSAPRGLCPRP